MGAGGEGEGRRCPAGGEAPGPRRPAALARPAPLSEGRGLTYVQRRLGYESIKTTSDMYGHLLPQADDDAMDTIERTLGGGSPADGVLDGGSDPSRVVYVIHLDGSVQGFYRRDDAVVVLEQWQARHGPYRASGDVELGVVQRMPGGASSLSSRLCLWPFVVIMRRG